ncbi:methyltransferase-like protein 17, mitochondrial isoform X2 [Asterias rubens]|nr:methyltransferase-like protein 17, mitochondrial isoform X2 [Asterias rubens]
MARYLLGRQRPLERADLRAKAKEFASIQGVNDIDDEMIRSPDLSKENKKKIASVMSKLKRHIYHWHPITYNETTSCAYMMSRIAPNYAVTYRVLNEIRKRMADFTPENLLDFGSGVGTTAWAAHSLWGDSLSEFFCVDTSRSMHELSDTLMRDNSTEEEEEAGNKTIIKGIYLRHFLPVSLQKKYDLTVSSFSLLELPSKADRLNTLRTLWHKTGQYLVLIECGTNEGYQTIMEARDFILNDLKEEVERNSQGQAVGRLRNREELGEEADPVDAVGHVFAPCQHDLACPRVTDGSGTPCNFEQDFHHFNKKGLVSELTSERFCYLVLKKGPRVPGDNDNHWPRIVRPVLARSRHVICRLCCANGQLQETVITKTKHGRELYRCARYSKWGDLLPISKQSEPKSLEAAREDHDNSQTDECP